MNVFSFLHKFFELLYKNSKHSSSPRGSIRTQKCCLSVCFSPSRSQPAAPASPLRSCYCLTSQPEIIKDSCWQVLWRKKQHSAGEGQKRQEGGSCRGPSALHFGCGAPAEVLRFGLGSWKSRKNPFPSLQTVVSLSVIEGLRIDLNYLGCLEKMSGEGADLKKLQ